MKEDFDKGDLMRIANDTQPVMQIRQNRNNVPLIESRDIKAILYLGIRGEIALPEEKHKVDISA